jgi:hypothetical protein
MTRVGTRFLRAMSVRVVGGLLIAMAALLALASEHGSRAQGLELELAVFGGGGTSQAMTAGSVDISVQSGTEMAFLASLAVRPRESGDPDSLLLDSRLRGNERSLWHGRDRRTQR